MCADTIVPMQDTACMVIKVGSALLVDEDSGRLRTDWLDALAEDIAAIVARHTQVVIVSSGAIASGRKEMNLAHARLSLEEMQAAAAIGMMHLANGWSAALGAHHLGIAQVLLTLEDTENRRRWLNARATLTTLMNHRIIPIINENDTVATDEIRFGDNDRLAARVAAMIGADTLVLLSDIDGFYTKDPNLHPDAQWIAVVEEITPAMENMASAPSTPFGSGGMVTKLEAAKIATGAGCRMAITDGHAMHPLRLLMGQDTSKHAPKRAPKRASWFLPRTTPRQARKEWIAGSLNPQGNIYIDAGANRALNRGSSLLPVGVVRVEGTFNRGDPVRVMDDRNVEIARGISAYNSADATRLAGHKTDDIAALLGYHGRSEIIHRDDLVMLRETP